MTGGNILVQPPPHPRIFLDLTPNDAGRRLESARSSPQANMKITVKVGHERSFIWEVQPCDRAIHIKRPPVLDKVRRSLHPPISHSA